MANCCIYELKIKGKEDNVKKLIGYLKANYDYSSKEVMSNVDKHFF